MIKRALERLAKTVVPWLVFIIMRLLFLTCRIKEHGVANRDDILKSDRAGIGMFWHYSIILILYQLRNNQASVMVSASKDGDYLARLAELLSFKPVRGSRNHGGSSALRKMLRDVAGGGNSGIVADGSQGPPLKVQQGGVAIASKTGAPILPMAWSASSYITFGSWDRTAVPKPFSKVDFFYGEPILVPCNLSSEELEVWRIKVEESLTALYQRAWALQGKQEH